MDKTKKYLQGGEVTQITPLARKIASQIPGQGREFIQNFFKWVKTSNYFQKIPGKEEQRLLDTEHLQRTVNQILKSRYAIACGEKTAVFITLCRTKGIPVKYVETVALEWLRQKSDANMHSHAFSEAYLCNKWVLIDPDGMKIEDVINYERQGYVKWAEGIDFRDLTDQEGRHHSWQSLDDLKKDTLVFKRGWEKINQSAA